MRIIHPPGGRRKAMSTNENGKKHPKFIRRRLMNILYSRYQQDPLEMLLPEDFLGPEGVLREELVANIHYLADRKLVELMIGYNPPLFAAARITADGIDLVENRFQFNLRFPPEPGQLDEAFADLPVLIEQLVEEVEFAPLDGEARMALLRDVQFLRDEIARPAHRWRRSVIETVLGWISDAAEAGEAELPALALVRAALARPID